MNRFDRPLLAALREEAAYLIHKNRPVFLALLLLPTVYSLLFGTVYRQNVIKQIPLAIYDQDQSSVSRKYIRLFDDSEKFRITAYVNSQEEMEQLLRNETALAAVAIPPDFAKHIKQGLGTQTALIVNSANNTFSNTAITMAWEINRTFAAGTGQQLLEGLNRLPEEAMNLAYPVHVSVRLLHNPLAGFSPFMLSGLAAQGIQIALLLAAGPILVREKAERRFPANVSTLAIMLGKTIPYWTTAVGAGLLALGTQKLVFAMPVRGSWLEIVLLIGVYAFAVLTALQLFSSLSPDPLTAIQIPMVFIMPGTLYGGLSWPLFAMNRPAELYASLMPIRYTAENLRDIMLAGYAPELWTDIRTMLIGCCVCLFVAWAVFNRKRKYAACRECCSNPPS